MIAIYAGSFSPPTLGHLDVIRRGAAMFDELVVAVLSQQAKKYLFSPEARMEMLRRITAEFPNVRVVMDTGLLVDVARREGADVIVSRDEKAFRKSPIRRLSARDYIEIFCEHLETEI